MILLCLVSFGFGVLVGAAWAIIWVLRKLP
jgi:hypothetical protein